MCRYTAGPVTDDLGFYRIDAVREAEPATRTFDTGATRDTDAGKLDYEGFFSPLVLKRRAEYMHVNRTMADGTVRDGDNWQKGMPPGVLMKSAFRHFMSIWTEHRKGLVRSDSIGDDICALMFNLETYLHQLLKEIA